MRKKLIVKVLSALMIVYFITANGGIQPMVAKATETLATGVTYSFEVEGILWNYEVDDMGNAINVSPADTTQMKENGSITSVIIPVTLDGRKVISIKGSAFDWCTNLTSINIPVGVTSIGSCAFRMCTNLSSIKIPDGITSIERFTFLGCSKLTSINILAGVTNVSDGAFYCCEGLKEILVSEDNTNYKSINGVLYSKDETEINCYPAGKADEQYKILDSVTSISDYAFSQCSNLTNIIIPQGVTSIPYAAFDGCMRLTGINIPEGVISIGPFAFENCTSLRSIKIPEKVLRINMYTFNSCKNLKSISIPMGLINIGWESFKDCTNLTTIYADSGSYASRYTWAFGQVDTTTGYKSGSLIITTKTDAEIKLKEGIKALLKYTIAGGLETETTYQALETTLSKYSTAELLEAETDMAKLTSWITELDGKITALNNAPINPEIAINSFTTSAVSPQELGKAITLSSTASGGTGILQTRFTAYDGTELILIKDYSTAASATWTPAKAGSYKIWLEVKDATGKVESKCLDYVINPIKYSCEVNGIVWNYEVNDMDNPVNAFNVYPSDKTLTSVKIPSTLDGKKVTSIKESAFLDCSSLSSVIIPEGVESIGKEAFKDCTSLERISIPSSVTNIDSTAFENCVKLTTIYTDSGSYASSYTWANGAVDTSIGYTKGSIIIGFGNYDTNSDGTVNIKDLANVAQYYNIESSDTNWQEKYDYNDDDIIDLYDLVKISKKIN